ncbi:restriction endonuclease subunit S [Nitrosomonas aestuarii]|uniref:restriction endonuclease subunit S n=1 Tax=Nitrosomonas aestuarii TaxID=52441 RepID=UPI000D473718|nr:restriction endonuclease subunit S [Nitrosomonas aestuarii]PTN09688.1 type I restriction enzyme S subunit [Nitrosomonas aestuarii]
MHVPEGWNIFSLSEITKEKISYGIVQAGPHVEDGIPYIRSSDVGGKIDIDSLQKTSKEIHHKYRRSSVHPGDIIFSLRGNIGEVSIVPDHLSDANLTQGTARISVDLIHDRWFVLYQLSSTLILNRITTLSKGSTFKEISLEELRKVQIPIAPLPEQQKIAQILSTWDKAIEKLHTLITAKQKRKKALMQQLLTGKKRFAGFFGEWAEVELGSLFKEVKEKVGEKTAIPHSITAGAGFVSHEEKWGKDISGSQYENYTLLKRNQFSYNKGNSKKYACGCMYLLKHADEIAVPNVFISFERHKDNVCNEFYEQYFIADYCARELRKHITSGARSDGLLNLSKVNFFSVKLPSPPYKEQQKIASVLSAADKEIETHQKELSALKQQKKGLMQQLLTGKKRVKIDEPVQMAAAGA